MFLFLFIEGIIYEITCFQKIMISGNGSGKKEIDSCVSLKGTEESDMGNFTLMDMYKQWALDSQLYGSLVFSLYLAHLLLTLLCYQEGSYPMAPAFDTSW